MPVDVSGDADAAVPEQVGDRLDVQPASSHATAALVPARNDRQPRPRIRARVGKQPVMLRATPIGLEARSRPHDESVHQLLPPR